MVKKCEKIWIIQIFLLYLFTKLGNFKSLGNPIVDLVNKTTLQLMKLSEFQVNRKLNNINEVVALKQL
jgi:hypothetical protein